MARKIETQGWCCHYCAKKMVLPVSGMPWELAKNTATFDHVQPLSKGGKNLQTNVVIACRACNNTKADKTPEAWDAILSVRFADRLGN